MPLFTVCVCVCAFFKWGIGSKIISFGALWVSTNTCNHHHDRGIKSCITREYFPVHLSSYFLPLLPAPDSHWSVFCLCCFAFSRTSCKWNPTGNQWNPTAFWVWFLLIIIMYLRFIPAVVVGTFLLLSSVPLYHYLFIHSPLEGHLGCF